MHIIHGHRHHHHRSRYTRNLSEVDIVYIRMEVIRVIGDNLCPIMADIKTSIIPLCPSYDVLEYDENRTPSLMRQVLLCLCFFNVSAVDEMYRFYYIYGSLYSALFLVLYELPANSYFSLHKYIRICGLFFLFCHVPYRFCQTYWLLC